MKDRNLNSSYGAAYYPYVKIRDDQTGTIITMPPSVVALGVLANTERAADVWFAPAGFNRGGLSQGAGGLTVTGVEQKLTSRNRDDSYEVNIKQSLASQQRALWSSDRRHSKQLLQRWIASTCVVS